MTLSIQSPFADALAGQLGQLAPLVRSHMAPLPGDVTYRGVMARVWRVGGLRGILSAPFLWLGSRIETLFIETGKDIPFTIVNRLYRGADGVARMTFERTFRFPGRERRFVATMQYDPQKRRILDSLGRGGHLLVELHPMAENGGLVIQSGKQWIAPFGSSLRIRLPRFIAGLATVREWQESEDRIRIQVTISNPVLGDIFGYEGTFERATTGQDSGAADSAIDQTDVKSLSTAARWSLACVAITATALDALSFLPFTRSPEVARRAMGIGVAAGASWIVLGIILVAIGPAPRFWRVADVCLRTMTVGAPALLCGAAVNGFVRLFGATAVSPVLIGFHALVLAFADLLMGACFVALGSRRGLSPSTCLASWVLVLNGTFVAGIWLT